MDSKNVQRTANKISKNDLRYWMARVERSKIYRPGGVVDESPFYSVKLQHSGLRKTVGLATASQTEAAARAKERYLYLVANGWNAFWQKYKPTTDQSKNQPGAKRRNVTVGEFITAAINESDLEPATIYPYIRAFRRIVSETMNVRPSKKRFDYQRGGNQQWIERIHAIPLSEITPEKITAWKKKFVAAAGADPITRRRATVSCNSYLRQAKALFSPNNVLSKLRTIELPAILPLQGVSVERRTDTKFYGCGVEPFKLLHSAISELGAARVQELKAFLLALVIGLRRREADMLEWQSFDFVAGTLRVMPTKWYQLKTNESAAMLLVDPEILALFRAWRVRATGSFVIESSREPKIVQYQWYRCDAVFTKLLGWLRDKGVQGQKPLHALRKLYGSVLAEKHGIHTASAGLRHADLHTTAQFYADRTVKVTAGFGAALSGADVVPFSGRLAENRS